MKTEQKSKHGGARPGAGRKPKLQYEARELFYSTVDARWDTIMATLDKLIAQGDYHVLRWVLEQRIGKAPQSLEIIEDTSEEKKEENWLTADALTVISELTFLCMTEDQTMAQAMQLFKEWYQSKDTNKVAGPEAENIRRWRGQQ
jgi:hypothetical protein